MANGCTIESLAPLVFDCVPPRIRKKRTVAEALEDNRWVSDIHGGLSGVGIYEFLQL
jgi:hypothetical protein